MAGFARKFRFSERRATMRTWSRGVGLLLLVASGVPNVVFVEEIVRQRGRYLCTTALRPNMSWPKYRLFHDPRPHGYSRHSSEARPPFSPRAEPSGASLRGTAEG